MIGSWDKELLSGEKCEMDCRLSWQGPADPTGSGTGGAGPGCSLPIIVQCAGASKAAPGFPSGSSAVTPGL